MLADTDGMGQECDGPVVRSVEGLSSALTQLSEVSSKVSVGVTLRLFKDGDGEKSPKWPLIYKAGGSSKPVTCIGKLEP